MTSTRWQRQQVVYAWCLKAFGEDQMMSPPQRGLRLMEESIELAQAVGCDKAQLHKLIDYVYNRPVGIVAAELGGVGLCLLALAQCCGFDADAAEDTEVKRVLSKPTVVFTQRNAEKNAAGFKHE